MSAIDQYKHKLLGFIECPSSFDIVQLNDTRKIAIYELLEDIPSYEGDFDGKIGDLLVGGGSGECPAFRISVPEAMILFTREIDDFKGYDSYFKHFWQPTEAFKLCDGFLKIGWPPDEFIEWWLAENISFLLIKELDQYSLYRDSVVELTSSFTLFPPAY